MECIQNQQPMSKADETFAREVRVAAGTLELRGTLAVPHSASGIVLFAHGSGSSRHSPRNTHVARLLERAGLATLLFDLLTRDEERRDALTGAHRFDIESLAERLIEATRWIRACEDVGGLPIGYFGASTGAAAALVAAAALPGEVAAVVSRGGRPDLAGETVLSRVTAPTLLIVGSLDSAVVELNQRAYKYLGAPKDIAIVAGATHLFEEPGTLDEVALLAARWLRRYLPGAGPAS